MKHLSKTITWVAVFAVAMGFLESAVVIYLRALYYPGGFRFPLTPMPAAIALVEILREAATVLMLAGIGFLAGKTRLQRFAFFSLAFGIWDIFYYVFLYLVLGWPQSLCTWDILFLIPLPWVGPVWAPGLLSLLMIMGSLFVIRQCDKNGSYRVAMGHWALLLTGALICILSFVWDYYAYHRSLWSLSSGRALFDEVSAYEPRSFNATLFLSGLLLMSAPVFYNILLSLKIKSSLNR